MNMCTKIFRLTLSVLACFVIAGCSRTARSISHSNYRNEQPSYSGYASAGRSDPGLEYKGELSEFDVLGITQGEVTSEAEIRRALDRAKQVKMPRGGSILLIQSGALFPDGPMVTELSKDFRVVPFSGVPQLRSRNKSDALDAEMCSKSLRLAAARGGADFIVCYWGMLESESENLATKTVSWVPMVNWILPDERQHMRIRLKVALIEVRTGNWAVLSPPAFDDARVSRSPRRGAVDQKQVEILKKRAYEASAKDLVRVYAGASAQN